MQYMDERKRRVREAEAQAKQDEPQARDEATEAPQEADVRSKAAAPAGRPARRVVSPPTSGSSTSSGAVMQGLLGESGPYQGGLAPGIERARDRVRRALRARQVGQAELPLGLPAEEGSRAARRSAGETRDELIERLMDPELTLQETAKLLNVCPTTVRRYTNRGVLNHFRTPGNQRRFRLSDVLEFMRRQQESQRRST